MLKGLPQCSAVKNLPAVWEMWVQSLGQEVSLEEGMATHSSILARKIDCSLAVYSPWGLKESNMSEVTEHACTHLHIQAVLGVQEPCGGHSFRVNLVA